MRKMRQLKTTGESQTADNAQQVGQEANTTEPKQPIAPTLAAHIEQIVNVAIEQKLGNKFREEAKESLEYVADRMGLTTDQALVFALFMEKSTDSSIQISDFSNMVGCRTVRIIAMMSDADVLAKRKLIKKKNASDEICYHVPLEVVTAVKENRAYAPESDENLSTEQLFDRIETIFSDDYDINTNDRLEALDELVAKNQQLVFCRNIKQYNVVFCCNRLLFYAFCHLLVNEDDDMIGVHNWKDYLPHWRAKDIERELNGQHNELQDEKIIEPCNINGMIDPEYYHLTQKAKNDLFVELKLASQQAKNDKSILKHTDISAKQLFYNAAERAQIDRLVSLLDPAQFTTVQQRLAEGGMRKGFACLFYGSPGTGKTETVYQIARRTGRDILPVDVSQIKSCWVGDSEKNIKKVFDKYRELVKQAEQAPILLFNEADAVLGIRQEGAERAVDKMENSIQNIILQEMETLDGIMIATTNLTQNLDKAFERRFLYKIEFAKPNIEAKRAIWQSMMPTLSAEDATALALAYDFSGGQIENIARKRTVETIINGTEPTAEQLHAFCRAEIVSRTAERRKIGY